MSYKLKKMEVCYAGRKKVNGFMANVFSEKSMLKKPQ